MFSSSSDFQWRVDVTISTTSLARVFKPSLLLSLALSAPSHRQLTVECSVEQFHKMRYEVARALKHLQELELHPALQKE